MSQEDARKNALQIMTLPEQTEDDDYQKVLQEANTTNPDQRDRLNRWFKHIRALKNNIIAEEVDFEKKLSLIRAQTHTKVRFKCSILRKKVKKGSELDFEEEEKDENYKELDFLTPIKDTEVNENDTSNELD